MKTLLALILPIIILAACAKPSSPSAPAADAAREEQRNLNLLFIASLVDV